MTEGGEIYLYLNDRKIAPPLDYEVGVLHPRERTIFVVGKPEHKISTDCATARISQFTAHYYIYGNGIERWWLQARNLRSASSKGVAFINRSTRKGAFRKRAGVPYGPFPVPPPQQGVMERHNLFVKHVVILVGALYAC
jgi:hypothetical protein